MSELERVRVVELVGPSLRESIGSVSCQLCFVGFYRIKKIWPANDNSQGGCQLRDIMLVNGYYYI